MPRHDITRELSHLSRILSVQLLLGFCSLQLSEIFLCYGLDEVYHMLPLHQACGLLFIIPQRAPCISLMSLRCRILSPLSGCPCIYLTFLLLEGSRPITLLRSEGSLGLQVSVVLRANILHLYHAPIHGGG
jgi:hypothetical protein